MWCRLLCEKRSVQDVGCKDLVQGADVYTPLQIDLDLPCFGPHLHFRIEVEYAPCVFGGVHDNGRVRQCIDLGFFAGDALGVSYDQALVGKNK